VTDALLETLGAIRKEPARGIELYRQLHDASLIAIVQRGSESSVASMLFLTYETKDGVQELPLFTRQDYVLPKLLDDSVQVTLEGPVLWPRLLDIVQTGRCEAAVDLGQAHGIRLTREMVLGMVSKDGGATL
jgi:SseB protein N-terminal domain